jgi:stearoyl-CoA desaturase (delta-9 desaturase)
MSRLATLVRWFDTSAAPAPAPGDASRVDWIRVIPFILLHLGGLLPLWTGWSPAALALAAGLYLARMFAITGFYHRYFSHRTFKTSRLFRFLMAFLANSSAQRGPLWWAAHHRHHHQHADGPEDAHSPVRRSFLWSHMFWFMSPAGFRTRLELVPDLARCPELRFLDRFDVLAPLALAAACYGAGELCRVLAPGLGADGLQFLAWGFFVSTLVLFHATCLINSLAHRFGRRSYATPDQRRNSLLLALLTLGEGWHNNHHRYPSSTRQGFRWWQIDITWLVLRALAGVGLVSELRPVPREVVEEVGR